MLICIYLSIYLSFYLICLSFCLFPVLTKNTVSIFNYVHCVNIKTCLKNHLPYAILPKTKRNYTRKCQLIQLSYYIFYVLYCIYTCIYFCLHFPTCSFCQCVFFSLFSLFVPFYLAFCAFIVCIFCSFRFYSCVDSFPFTLTFNACFLFRLNSISMISIFYIKMKYGMQSLYCTQSTV